MRHTREIRRRQSSKIKRNANAKSDGNAAMAMVAVMQQPDGGRANEQQHQATTAQGLRWKLPPVDIDINRTFLPHGTY